MLCKVYQSHPQDLLALQHGGGVFSRAAATLKSEKTLGTRLGSSQGCSLLKLLSNTLVSFTSCCGLKLYHSVICGQLSVDLKGFVFRFNLLFLYRCFVSFWPTSPMIALYSDFGPTGFLAGFSLTFQGY